MRATGITDYLKHEGTLENAQQMANHSSPRTTKLYDRRNEEASLMNTPRWGFESWVAAHPRSNNLRPLIYIWPFLKRQRLDFPSITGAMSGGTALPAPLVQEFCYLQLRMLCELVALGCLTAHGDIKETQAAKLQKEWSADKIISQLEALHPNFYPHPIRMTIAPERVDFDRLESGFLTKTELIQLYGKCGDRLHRGTSKKLPATMQQTKPPDFTEIAGWASKIITLLNQHHIASFDNLSHFICMLRRSESEDQAQVALALSPLP